MTEGEQRGIVGSVTAVSSKLITALPAQMLLTLILNCVFIISLFWLLHAQNASRERALLPLLAACSQTVPSSVLESLLPRLKEAHP